MAFQSMLTGAECSTGANPLRQVLKQAGDDRSLQQDSYAPGHGGPQQARYRTTATATTTDAGLAAEQQRNVEAFFGNGAAGPRAHYVESMANGGLGFDPKALEQEMMVARQGARQMGMVPQTTGPMTAATARNWAGEFQPDSMNAPLARSGAQDQRAREMEESFFRAQNVQQAREGFLGPAEAHQPWMNDFDAYQTPALAQRIRMCPGQMGQFDRAYQRNFDWSKEFALRETEPAVSAQSIKGKNKVVELDDGAWEAQFARLSTEDAAAAATDATIRLDEEANKAIDHELDQEGDAYLKQFEGIWDGLKQQFDQDAEYSAWEREFNENNYEDHGFDDNLPTLGIYELEKENPFQEHADPFEEGLRLLRAGENLSEAARAFEAACKRQPNRSEAWMYLGQTQAQNEKEERAVQALEKAVQLDPQNVDALMSLAVSYTNEGFDRAAYTSLERWMEAKYPQLASSISRAAPDPSNPWDAHSRVTELFLHAARARPGADPGTQGEMDPDVQVGLGVLFYGNSDYDKAVDCFSAAVRSRPDDWLLWNRLGATLANSGRSEEAISSYEHALSLRPSFVRARYNLAVACLNIGVYKEAAEHLLGALAMHQTDVAPPQPAADVPNFGGSGGHDRPHESNNLWSTLRRAFIAMSRRDLADKAEAHAPLSAFRSEFEF